MQIVAVMTEISRLYVVFVKVIEYTSECMSLRKYVIARVTVPEMVPVSNLIYHKKTTLEQRVVKNTKY